MPNVLCWESLVNDQAAKIFSVAFFKALLQESIDSPQPHPNPNFTPNPNLNLNPKPNPDLNRSRNRNPIMYP